MIGQCEYDILNDQLYADALMALMLSIDPAATAVGVSLKAFLSGVHPDDREHFISEIKSSTKTGLCYTFEYRACSADGPQRPLLNTAQFPKLSDDGQSANSIY